MTLDARLLTAVLVAATACSPALAADGAMPIYQPTTITQSGNYVLTQDVTGGGAAVLTIQASNVSVDLNGFTLEQTDPSNNVVRVTAAGPTTLHDGRLVGGTHGVRDSGPNAIVRLYDLDIVGAGDHGVEVLQLGSVDIANVRVEGPSYGIELTGAASLSASARLKGIRIENVSETAISGVGLRNAVVSEAVIVKARRGLFFNNGASDPQASVLIGHANIQADLGVRVWGMSVNIYESTIMACERAIEFDGVVPWQAALITDSIARRIPFASCHSNITGPLSLAGIFNSHGTQIVNTSIIGDGVGSADNSVHGVEIDGSSHVSLHNVTVHNHGDDGLHATNSDHLHMTRSRVTGSGRHGVYLEGDANAVEDCAVGNNGQDGLHFASPGHVYRRNLLLRNGQSGTGSAVGGPASADTVDGGENIQ